MKYISIFFTVVSINANAQKLYFAASLGWGYGILSTGHFSETNNVVPSTVNYNAPGKLSNFFAEPQIDYLLEYRINKKHALSFGRMSGITENRISVTINNRSGYTMFGGLYRKWGLTYTYTLHGWKAYLGCYAAHNWNFLPDSQGTKFISITKDSQGITSDSSFTGDFSVRRWGMTSSIGFGYMFYNKKKNRDRFSINLLLDIGWFKLNGVKDFVLHDYNRTLTSFSYSTGSQLKIYFSKPILMYDLKKDKFHLF